MCEGAVCQSDSRFSRHDEPTGNSQSPTEAQIIWWFDWIKAATTVLFCLVLTGEIPTILIITGNFLSSTYSDLYYSQTRGGNTCVFSRAALAVIPYSVTNYFFSNGVVYCVIISRTVIGL